MVLRAPSQDEIYNVVLEFISQLKQKLIDIYSKNGVNVEIYEVGSAAKGTFIPNDCDVDFYIVAEDCEKAFELAKQHFPGGAKKHGSLLIWNFTLGSKSVDLVFARPSDAKVDTIRHTKFYNESLTPEMKREVVKAKILFKSAGVYGAENGGITGVAIEELIRLYGTLENACKFIVEHAGEKPFLQDPVMKKPRNLLASIVPLRWRQIVEACRGYLETKVLSNKGFTEEDFVGKYRDFHFIAFERSAQKRRDKYADFLIALSETQHTVNQLKNLEPDVDFEYDVFVGSKIIVAVKARPEKLSETKIIRFKKAFVNVGEFKKKHPNAFEDSGEICAEVRRKFVDPIGACKEELVKRMIKRGYKPV